MQIYGITLEEGEDIEVVLPNRGSVRLHWDTAGRFIVSASSNHGIYPITSKSNRTKELMFKLPPE